jgi:hypothetical protein
MIRAILTVALCAPFVAADEKPKPLVLKVSGTAKYKLDLGGKTEEEYKKAVLAAAADGTPLPTPAVELEVEVTNTTDKPVQLWTSGDPVVLTLRLKGKGALNLEPSQAFTEEFRLPNSVEVAAGKSRTFTVTSLTSGFRRSAHCAYWTAPGEYELVVELKTGANPPPKGAENAGDGFGKFTLTSKPFKVTVE